ncbi:alpha/beta hydrolase [Halobacillus salinarum]|uniref:Alpha/beta hydrolase n=1 Tax=Halobacillus salinarum TaxID=2932257 RepID=A0ABY4EPH9_9BACI|nr:alpha/beta hydrolase [Halobacillus salinarum]UOQ45768.1 alpha/beta hydrolase [Halobacillus salinarum]
MKQNMNFKSKTNVLAAFLYLPTNFDENKKYPAITVAHPGGGVKEQAASTYAEKLSELGFVTLAYDASHQGESEGDPKYQEDPYARTEDVRASVDYLTTLNYVDVDNIGALGICAGGGYSVAAAQTERRIKALATVSMVDIGSLFREGVDRIVPVEQQIELLEQVSNQRTEEAQGGEVSFTTYVPDEIDDSMPIRSTMAEGHEYYVTDRGRHENAPNRFTLNSFSEIATFSAFSHINQLLTHPFLSIAGSDADTRYFSEEAVEQAASKNKELFIIDGATHVGLYDIPEYVEPAVEKLHSFFSKYIK